MGIVGSRALEFDEAYKIFSERERQQIIALFDKLAMAKDKFGNKVLEYEAFKVRIDLELIYVEDRLIEGNFEFYAVLHDIVICIWVNTGLSSGLVIIVRIFNKRNTWTCN